jgi:hypothetical protein
MQSFGGDFDEVDKDFERTVSFEIKLKALLIISYMQLKKTFLLLKDRSYAKDRGSDFPFHKFAEFEKDIITFLSI